MLWTVNPFWILALLCAAIACAGMGQVLFGLFLVRNQARASRRDLHSSLRTEAVTVLKPLYGSEPLLEEALVSLCRQDHAALQIVCGVQDARDPAIAVVRRVMTRFPERDIVLVVDGTGHGRNRKIGNLINMYAVARHDVLVIADSDVHVAPDYVGRLLTALDGPGVGLVTTPYSGLPGSRDLAGLLGASGISHGFLPGTMMARALGRSDCLGATMAIRRPTLDAIGGLRALASHVADDHMLGLFVKRLGFQVATANTVPATTVPETRLRDLFRHELRWSRTIASFVPVKFALSSIQYPIAWAALALLLSGFEEAGFAVFLAAWLVRAVAVRLIDHMLGLNRLSPALIWLLPLRDAISLLVVAATYLGNEVEWRGETMRVRRHRLNPLDTLPIGTKPL